MGLNIDQMTQIDNIQLVDASGNLAVIKPASTAALATDTSLVVALSPNTALPTGANVIGAVTQSGTWNIGTLTTLTSITNPVAVTQSGTWNITNISGTISLPTGASTSALQTTGNTSLSTIATTLTLAQGSTTSGQTGSLQLAAVTTAAPSYTTGQSSPFSLTLAGALRVDGSGVTQPVSGSVSVSNFPVTQPVSGTVTANQGTSPWIVAGGGTAGASGTAALTVQGIAGGTAIPISGTVTATNPSVSTVAATPPTSATYIGGSVTTAAPTYATAQMNALSLNTSGGLRVDGSGVTQPVSGTVAATQSGTWNIGTVTTLTSITNPVAVTQSGTWTVQPGNTANTTPWLVTVSTALPAGANTIGSVNQGTSPWIVQDNASNTSGATAATRGLQVMGVFNTTPATLTTGQSGFLQLDSVQNLLVNLKTALPAGTNTIGVVNQGTAGASPWAENLTQVGGSAIALGQTTMVASLPVTIASNQSSLPISFTADTTPATQTVTAADAGSVVTSAANGMPLVTGTPTAGSAASFAVSSLQGGRVQVTGTWTGTIQGEVSMDGGVTWAVTVINQLGSYGLYNSPYFTGNFVGTVDLSGVTNFRMRAVTAWTGTATVRLIESTVSHTGFNVQNPIKLLDQFNGSLATIKPASTAAATTDTAIVVTMSPNTPLPSGTNTIGIVEQVQDFSPATQNITVVDSSSTFTTGLNGQALVVGTPTAGSAASFTLTSVQGVRIQVTGTWTGTLQSEISLDGGTTWFITQFIQIGLPYVQQAISGNMGAIVDVGGATNLRIRATTAITGTAVVKILESTISDTAAIVINPMKIADSISNELATVKNPIQGPLSTDTQILTGSIPVDGTKASYSMSATVTTAATATDVFTIVGSASKTIRVLQVTVSGISTTAITTPILLIKRSAANTGGTSTAMTAVPHDSNSAAATATGAAYTVNPTGLGAAVGTVRQDRLSFEPTATTAQDPIVWEFGTRPAQAIVLRGTAQVLAVNLNSTTVTGGSMSVSIEWTEE